MNLSEAVSFDAAAMLPMEEIVQSGGTYSIFRVPYMFQKVGAPPGTGTKRTTHRTETKRNHQSANKGLDSEPRVGKHFSS